MRTVLQDVRFGVRLLVRNPAFTLSVVLTTALGIGATIAIFSVVNAVLIRALPFPHSGRLVNIWSKDREFGPDYIPLSPLDFEDIKKGSSSLQAVGMYAPTRMNLTGVAMPERLSCARVSSGALQAVEVRPVAGRLFDESDDQAGSQIALVRAGLQDRLAGTGQDIIGRSLTLDGKPYTVVGILPESFAFPVTKEPVEVWVPMAFRPLEAGNRGYRAFDVIGLVKPGVSIERSRSEVAALGARLESSYPDTNKGVSDTVVGVQDFMSRNVRLPLLILFGAVSLLLLLACINVANILIARAISREREIAIRASLGAGSAQIARQLLIEGLLLSLIGGALGLLLAKFGAVLLVRIAGDQIPRIGEVGIDGRAVTLTVFISLLVGLVFGLAPALQAYSRSLMNSLKEGHTTGAGRHGMLRTVLVVLQVAVSLVLLLGAGLLMNSFIRLNRADLGFTPDHVLTAQISLSRTRYKTDAAVQGYFRDLLRRVLSVPGVDEAAVASHLPMSGAGASVSFAVEGRAEQQGKQKPTDIQITSPNYFNLLRIPLMQGRIYSDTDDANAPGVILINQQLAAIYFPNESPIGKRIILGISYNGSPQPREIVGVVGNVRDSQVSKASDPEIYLPYQQLMITSSMTLLLQTGGDPRGLIGTVRSAALDVDHDQPLGAVQPLESYVAGSIAQPRFYAILFAAFALLGLIIATAGVYGVISYMVAQRTHEIGVRMALGSSKAKVLGLVIGRAMLLGTIGLGIGLGVGLFSSRLLAGQLYGIKPNDPLTLCVVAVALIAAVFFASFQPAHRATSIDPVHTLKCQ